MRSPHPRHGRVDRITPGRGARQDAVPWNSELASHPRSLENHTSRKRRGAEVKDSRVGVPPGNILRPENRQDDSRCGWEGEEVRGWARPAGMGREVRRLGQWAPRGRRTLIRKQEGLRCGPCLLAPCTPPSSFSSAWTPWREGLCDIQVPETLFSPRGSRKQS